MSDQPLPEELARLVDGRALAHVATIDPDGSPQASAMWVMRDGDRLVFNTAEGRRKLRNIRRDPRVAISITGDYAYENYSIQGRVVDIRTTDGIEVIDALARKYLDGVEKYPWLRPGMVRVTFVVEVTRIAGYDRRQHRKDPPADR